MRFGQKSKTTTITTKHDIRILARVGNRTRGLLHPKRMRSLWTIESTESTDLFQAI